MIPYYCNDCKRISYSSAHLRDLYFKRCPRVGCNSKRISPLEKKLMPRNKGVLEGRTLQSVEAERTLRKGV